ncbi:hypothetical protein [Pseudoalteromonas sp. OOF1S-7]|uniref:hypothetical protein n=1 Tax=Pseudoalteromonas sp. OOF1S-7 TaxID=2917757 RepID=UPI001EF46B8B|nr:hypothetical protein [Pseudoalteromonas sp. OOF1S-7]MCG7534378.1 hypothetical protein [Pseudoalteromonas sp. OOF1S-7]
MSKDKLKKNTSSPVEGVEISRRKMMYALPVLGGAAILGSKKSQASESEESDASSLMVTSSLDGKSSTTPRALSERFTDRVYAKDFGATMWHQDTSASSNIPGLKAAFEFANQESHNGERKVVDCGPSRISVNKSTTAAGVVDFNLLDWPKNTTVNYTGPAGEQVLFLNHFSNPYGGYPNGVPVNELNITAPYHPGLILNVKTKASFGQYEQKAHQIAEAAGSDTVDSSSIGFRIDDENIWQWTVNGDRSFHKNLWSQEQGLLVYRFVMSGNTGDVGIQRRNPQYPMDIAGGMRVIATDENAPGYNQYDNVKRFPSPEIVLENNIQGKSNGIKLGIDETGKTLKIASLDKASAPEIALETKVKDESNGIKLGIDETGKALKITSLDKASAPEIALETKVNDESNGIKLGTDETGKTLKITSLDKASAPEIALETSVEGQSKGIKLGTSPNGDMLSISALHNAPQGSAYLGLDRGYFYTVDGYSPSWQGAAFKLGHNTVTQRSINVSGTINTDGRDYAEYMVKNETCGDIRKGDVCGIDSNGQLTDKWHEAVSFVVKSTNPSFVGGDDWHENGFRPLPDAYTEEEQRQHLEAQRKKVDRIAFCGQVPVNIIGAEPGSYLVPVDANGGIGVVAKRKSDLSFSEYMDCIGQVIAVEEDGRARVIVKVS